MKVLILLALFKNADIKNRSTERGIWGSVENYILKLDGGEDYDHGCFQQNCGKM